jgi:hypothetical protein
LHVGLVLKEVHHSSEIDLRPVLWLLYQVTIPPPHSN